MVLSTTPRLFATLDDFEFPAETGDWSKVAKHFKTKLRNSLNRDSGDDVSDEKKAPVIVAAGSSDGDSTLSSK